MKFKPRRNAPADRRTRAVIPALPVALILAFGPILHAGDTVRPGLTRLEYRYATDMHVAEADLILALRDPLLEGRNVEKPLQAWFDGRLAEEEGDLEKAADLWRAGLQQMGEMPLLPQQLSAELPDADLTILRSFEADGSEDADFFVVSWMVGNLKQYGVLVTPKNRAEDKQYPLLLYAHGAAYGVPTYALPWLAGMAKEGYVIIGPAFRGEDLFATYVPIPGLDFKCEGEIENLDGEVDDALTAIAGARKLPYVSKGKLGVLGHSFGSGAGMLAAARHPDVACLISYDAWLTNPFRFYWDRMRRGANNWLSWADFCNRPVADQLAGLMKRSIVHHADRLNCPMLLFIGGGYEGSVFHKSHDDLVKALEKHGKTFEYDVVPDGGHNFVLYYESEAAKYAYAKHMTFLRKHLPPVPPGTPPPVPDPGDPGVPAP